MSKSYAPKVSADKIHHFVRKFFHFSEVCRNGYLKPLPSKLSRSELFPNQLPRKGMETVGVGRTIAYPVFLSKPTSPQGDGNVLGGDSNFVTGGYLSKPTSPQGDGNELKNRPLLKNRRLSFQTNFPARGLSCSQSLTGNKFKKALPSIKILEAEPHQLHS